MLTSKDAPTPFPGVDVSETPVISLKKYSFLNVALSLLQERSNHTFLLEIKKNLFDEFSHAISRLEEPIEA